MLFENLEKGSVSKQMLLTNGLGGPSGVSMKDAVDMMTPGSMKRQRAAMLRHMNELVDVARKPPHEWKAALTPLEGKVAMMPVLVRLLVPATVKVAEADIRRFALVRTAITGVAAERYRLSHDKWPESLDVLVKEGLLKEVPLDPYDGKPLRFKRLVDGLIVYALGPDGQDNGGKRDPHNPIAPGTDIGFRLWNQNSRRQPPKPPKPVEVPSGMVQGNAPSP